MTVRNLHHFFDPQSVAVIGASMKDGRFGTVALKNLVAGGFKGDILPVNPKYESLEGLDVYANIADLPSAPDLALICTPPHTITGLIGGLGERGTRAVLVLTGDLDAPKPGGDIRQKMLDAARPYTLRILGPNSVGLLAPRIGLNAGLAPVDALPGKIAFVSQSGALAAGVLDWARSRGIGFSRFVSLGESADVDLGDMLDFLAGDIETHAILLHVEQVRAARKFMSAARAAARTKPVVIVKAGLDADDDVYDAAIRRAGMLRVRTTEDLFHAAETLAHGHLASGERLAILTNGRGPGLMAADELARNGIAPATLSDETMKKLDAALPCFVSRNGLVDIGNGASAQDHAKALEIVLRAPEADAVLFLHAPAATVPGAAVADAVAPLARNASRNLLACWLGGEGAEPARRLFSEAGIPTYATPEEAVGSFMQTVQYRRNQALLMQVPSSPALDSQPDRARASAVVKSALAEGRADLSGFESREVLAAYGIPVVKMRIAATAQEAERAAREIGFPVAIKLLSPDIEHTSGIGGTVLDIESGHAVIATAAAMQRRLAELRPDAKLSGFSVQSMARRPNAIELAIGMTNHPVFGPVIRFGQHGARAETANERAAALPPLNAVLARDLISRTRVSALLAGSGDRPPADADAICQVLIQAAQLVADMPEIAALDIDSLLADDRGVVALDARISIMPPDDAHTDRLAIRPYPKELETQVDWNGRTLLLRPIRPEDGARHVEFFNSLTPEDIRYRMFISTHQLQPSQLARLTQIDYDCEMAFIAVGAGEDGNPQTMGVARAVCDPDNVSAEFAVIVRSDLKGHGLGALLMQKLIDYCRRRGTREMVGEALAGNRRMLKLAERLGFEVTHPRDIDTMTFRLDLARLPSETAQSTVEAH